MQSTTRIVGEKAQPANPAIQIPFGVGPDGRLVEPHKVRRGLACGCTCPGCGQPLIARRGRVRQAHFAHVSDATPCVNGTETALHRMAKQVLAEMRGLGLPALNVRRTLTDSRGRVHEDTEQVFDARVAWAEIVEIEVERHQIGRPDAVMRLRDGSELLVEFRVAHAVEKPKRDRSRKRGAAMLEIDLRPFFECDTHGEIKLRQFLLGARHRHWISHPDWHRVAARLDQRLKDRVESIEPAYAIEPDGMARCRPLPKPQYRALCPSCGPLLDRRGVPLVLHLWPNCPHCRARTVPWTADLSKRLQTDKRVKA